jgi:FSR family fosmidomycin resistance protein-like MFS transporter
MFWLYILMQSEEVSGLITTVIALSGAIATFIGGRIADKLGFRKMIRVGLMALVPCMFILAITRSVLISLIVLVPAAVALNLAYSPSVVLGQKLLPNHIGFASGVTMGLASSIGGLFSPILGRVADTQGVDVVMWIMFAICVVAAVSTVILPEDPDLKVKNS